MNNPTSIDDSLPLNPRIFAILMALSEGDAHGSRIKKTVETQSSGALKLDPGSLYRSIARMVDDGWIVESEAPSDAEDARRRYYGLTPLGRRVLSAEAVRLAGLVDTARALNLA